MWARLKALFKVLFGRDELAEQVQATTAEVHAAQERNRHAMHALRRMTEMVRERR